MQENNATTDNTANVTLMVRMIFQFMCFLSAVMLTPPNYKE